MRAPNKPSKKRVVPVGNEAPWTFGGPPLGGKASKGPRKTKKTKIRNKAPKGRVPNIGNTTSGGMWGY